MTTSLYYQNVRGLNGKTHLVLPLLSLFTYDLICFTETWLSSDINNSELFPPNQYIVHRSDRSTGTSDKQCGGGVLIAAKRKLQISRPVHFERPNLEMVWIRVGLLIPVYLCCIYIPNRSLLAPYVNFMKCLLDNVAMIPETDYRLLICGDFNLSTINWLLSHDGSLIPVDFSSDDLNGINSDMVDTMTCFELRQFNNRFNVHNRLLDLVLCDFPPLDVQCTEPEIILCPLIDPQHPPLQLTLNVAHPPVLDPVEPPQYDFSRANYRLINETILETPWESLLIGSVDEMFDKFYNVLNSIIQGKVPLKRRRFSNYPVWFSSSLIHKL